MKSPSHSCLLEAKLPMIDWDEAVKDVTDCKHMASHFIAEKTLYTALSVEHASHLEYIQA